MSYLGTGQQFAGAVEIGFDPMLARLLGGMAVDQGNFHEIPALVRYAARLGADLVELRLGDDDLSDLVHPLHLAFLETLRDPALDGPLVDIGNLAGWRVRAFESELPSDDLPAGYTHAMLADAIRAARRSPEVRAALCAAGRIRFPDNLDLLAREAKALYELGFRCEARTRLAQCVVLGGEAIAIF